MLIALYRPGRGRHVFASIFVTMDAGQKANGA
jgi:hypothetical protein